MPETAMTTTPDRIEQARRILGGIDTPEAPAPSACCGSAKQAVCCEPSEKASCCGSPNNGAGGCGCQ